MTLEDALLVLGRELATVLTSTRGGGIDRTRMRALTLIAEEMGLKEWPLQEAAKAGKLRAWRSGGDKRGQLVSTIEAVEAYLDTQPAATEDPKKKTLTPKALTKIEDKARIAGLAEPFAGDFNAALENMGAPRRRRRA